jgi:hypothetical protein
MVVKKIPLPTIGQLKPFFNQQQLLFLVVGNSNFSSTYNRPTKTIFPLTIIIIFNHWQSNFPLPFVTTHRA